MHTYLENVELREKLVPGSAWTRAGSAILSLFLAGCGGAEVTRVNGQVLIEGQPFSAASVCFWPKEDLELGVLTAFHCDDEGGFEIHPDPEQGQGKAGLYAVLLLDKGMSFNSKIAGKYKHKDSTPFVVDVGPGIVILDPFDLEANREPARSSPRTKLAELGLLP